MELLDSQPIWRWFRFDVEKLPLDALMDGLQILSVMKEPRALYKFASELLNRPMKETPPEARYLAFEGILDVCLRAGKLEEALQWVEKAKNEAMEEKRSDAAWNFHEITIMLGLGRAEEAHALLGHLVNEHGREEGVMQALNNLFVRLGLINPDGTATARAMQARELQQAEPASGLWTPDAETGVPARNTSKLWTPD
jgi:tetratricopeptide (TPR) repeat protein